MLTANTPGQPLPLNKVFYLAMVLCTRKHREPVAPPDMSSKGLEAIALKATKITVWDQFYSSYTYSPLSFGPLI